MQVYCERRAGYRRNKPEAGVGKHSCETGCDKAKQTGGMSVAEIAGANAGVCVYLDTTWRAASRDANKPSGHQKHTDVTYR